MVSMRTLRFLVAFTVLAGCSASNNVQFTSSASSSGSTGSGAGTGGSGAGTSSSSSGSAGTGGQNMGGGTIGIDGGTGTGGGGPMAPAEVFGHSADTLYKLDPTTKVVTIVGGFPGCNASLAAVIDIALDKDGQMYATTFGGFYKVDKATSACTHIKDGGYPNSLSFVPKGTVDPNVEALVGYNGATYVRIDLVTGAITTVGSLGAQGYSSSGDVVSVIGGGTYLTVKGGAESCDDCIIEVNPTTGAYVKTIGKLPYTNVYGLAYWGGSAYGFDDSGHLFQIDLTNGSPTLIPIPNAPPNLFFFGAGSTTSAPLKPPQ